MSTKLFWKSLLTSVIVLTTIVLFIELSVNQDDENYESSFEYINASKIKTYSDDFVIIIISPYCSGIDSFMPEVKEVIEKLDSIQMKYYLISDAPITAESDNELSKILKDYQLNNTVYHFDKIIYKTNGGLLNSKRRYYDFVLDLSPEAEELYLGSGYYIVFSEGKLKFDTYNHNKVLNHFER